MSTILAGRALGPRAVSRDHVQEQAGIDPDLRLAPAEAIWILADHSRWAAALNGNATLSLEHRTWRALLDLCRAASTANGVCAARTYAPALLVMDLPAYLADLDRPDRPAAIAPELRTARTDTSSVSRSYLAWKELTGTHRRLLNDLHAGAVYQFGSARADALAGRRAYLTLQQHAFTGFLRLGRFWRLLRHAATVAKAAALRANAIALGIHDEALGAFLLRLFRYGETVAGMGIAAFACTPSARTATHRRIG